MPYLGEEQLRSMGFAALGRNVKVSDKASIYDCDRITLGDNSRIDDFCVLAGRIDIGRNVHITVYCNLAGGRAGIVLEDFSTLAYGCHIIAQTDDYSGVTMANSTIPAEFKNETSLQTVVSRHSILGTGCVVLPGVVIAEGTAGGARTVFTTRTEPWGIYVGTPARRVRERSRELLELEAKYLAGYSE